MLYIFGGLPATGKSELSKFLASSIGAVYIRIDTIEQELRNAGFKNLYDEGYKIAFSIALDNLRNGLSVVADSTNPVAESRQAWVSIAKKAEAPYTEIEIICSNKSEHRSRVESRKSDIPNLVPPDWGSVISREYQLWYSADIFLDTAGKTPEQSKHELSKLLSASNET
ncbi:AAA family ATPase [Alloalcanivorax gelatiniphagus]|uniref:ATP-binding protein n=1 Tax=Alloalcanivorax gelatiniphagus TaxID=1194167 RepID=A0ABY2XK13_9GAMM|nr:AAA family ATPase [Alloalcanivorax gelatiniphagus]TMW11953.1 ATP-binding protein [Alloalcanivorax gelatiniphagus]